jgi:integrase
MKDKLSPAFCSKNTKKGRYADGGNLYLFVKDAERKSWVFRYVDLDGTRRDMGLGRYGAHYVTLAKARELAGEQRALIAEFKDPMEERRRLQQEAKQARAKRLTFGQCATQFIESNKHEWKNPKHTAQWSSTLETYAKPVWNMPVADIDTDDVVRCLEPHWTSKTETMTRVRQRIEKVMAWATVRKLRTGDNPARWRGHLDTLLAKPNKLKKVTHRAALPYAEVGQFMSELRAKDSLAARALELQILTATRPGEVVNATWDEFDLKAGLWTIPAGRMKAGKEHEIPLPTRAVKLLKALPRLAGCDWVFPGLNSIKPMTTAAGMKLLKELRPGLTQHGFRATFRIWAAEQTNFARDIIEHALAHQLKDKAEASYYRSTVLPKRRKLMAAWSDYCDVIQTQKADNVTPIGKQA